ncbi:hypothetical protein CLU85_2241 [Acidovorax sp. 69]|uniref:DUF6152 family protein n=1 Tax=Acidovorax sp. 69 TaxID=2035202 RepID=UPI000CC2B5F6|nr:DUF6152 family protein [Acidovorax sp. 69]PJI97451.1 hypothetical protein CLU85_2241 [Acidovorax sp. 69]
MTLQRRHVLAAAATALPLGVHAHHGWSSFDPDRPIYLEGTVRKVRWQNPHAELELELPDLLKLPTDLAQRPIPAQTAPVDGRVLLAKVVLPTRKDRLWAVELAPLTRMQAWQVQEIKPGTLLSVVGFTLRGEKGEAVLRAEYLFVDGKAYGLRSGPA